MLSLSPAKLLIVFVVAMILLGPDKLPRLARQLGSAWRTFGAYRERMESEVRKNMPDLPSTDEIARLARSPVAFLNRLADMPADGLEPPVLDPGAENGNGHGTPGSDVGPWPSDRAADVVSAGGETADVPADIPAGSVPLVAPDPVAPGPLDAAGGSGPDADAPDPGPGPARTSKPPARSGIVLPDDPGLN